MDKVLHRNSKVVTILRNLLVSYMITGLLLLLLAFLMMKADVSSTVLNGGILLTYVLSSFVGGFLLGKSADSKRFLWGLGMGALYFIMLILISVLTNSVMGMEVSRVITVMVICLFSGMLGGMIS
ncbi:TIGR04086 family membrane protein [Anaerocolumna sp. AGMB13025]|uniref:TIGR04086 family membrane protein n=1 Tax=Anaerocolumna sp. AGMB13025 TaxID=3039116 RepID=UPI00241EC8A0|nr:TIGR04086 family membrane protein [Anaerocolumna sp. AGMB13025]WFR56181.1 TIGR04086 family membrane protein [Anaerocolumna sp. AGMB13025]